MLWELAAVPTGVPEPDRGLVDACGVRLDDLDVRVLREPPGGEGEWFVWRGKTARRGEWTLFSLHACLRQNAFSVARCIFSTPTCYYENTKYIVRTKSTVFDIENVLSPEKIRVSIKKYML